MNARGNISARPRKCHVADLDAPARCRRRSRARPCCGGDSVVRRPVQTAESPRNYGPRVFVI